MTERFLFAALSLSLAACSEAPPAAAGDNVPIAAVQGPGDTSPLVGRVVTIRGVVTGDFQDYGHAGHGSLGGFYVQSLEPDADDSTSEGLFVFENGERVVDVNTGDAVEVAGTVAEFFGETQLVAASIRVVGTADVTPVDVSLPANTLEPFEGMLVRFPQQLVVASNRNLGRFGSLTLAVGDRPYQFTNVNAPDRDAFAAAQAAYRLGSLVLDDGLRAQNPDTVRYASGDVPPRTGNASTGLTGNLRWSRGSGGDGNPAYRLMPTLDPEFTELNPRPPAPTQQGNLRVASFNLLNLFSGTGRDGDVCGPDGEQPCRGASTPEELARQLEKSVTAIAAIKADIVGLAEIENNDKAALNMLVDALGEAGHDYRYVDAGIIGGDSIKVGFLYDPTTVELVGDFALLTRTVDGRFDDRRNRPALAQTFALQANGATLTVVANHLKSKGSDCDDVNDPNPGDGQGNCNRTRMLAATALADWSTGGPTDAGSDRVLIVGDLNAYLREDPIRALEAAGFVNLLDRHHGNAAYTYVYDGRAGALDHALASAALADQVLGASEWHSNADEPGLFDYNLDFGRNRDLFAGDEPWRSSDHDPVIVDLFLSP